MKKVMSVNIGGLVFQIDNEAYAKLDGYIGALEKQFQSTEGSEEIIGDIESRIAEIFQEKIKAGRESIRMEDIEEIVRIMGAPKDLRQEAEETPELQATVSSQESSTSTTAGSSSVGPDQEKTASGATAPKIETGSSTEPGPKRFFRSNDDKLLGGVCSGFATYIDADPLVVRLAFLLAVLGFGVGPVLYLILWIIVPEAKTTSEKLQMRGEKVTIDSIEKAIRKEANDLKKRFGNIKEDIENDPNHPVNQAGKRGRDFFAEAGDSISKLFRIGVKVFIGLLVSVILISVFTAIFGVTGGLGYATFLFPGMMGLLFSTAAQANLMIVGLIAVISIPLIIVAYKGMRFLLGIKVGTKPLDAVFLVSWIIGLGLVIVVGARVASEFQREVSYREEVPMTITPVKTIYLNKLDPPVRSYRHADKVKMDDISLSDDSIFFQKVTLDIEPAAGNKFALYTLRRARGKDREQAIGNARSIQYHFREGDSVVALSGEYTISDRSWRGNELSLLVEVPVGKQIVIDERLRSMLSKVRMKSFIPDDELYNQPLLMSSSGLETIRQQGQ